MKKPIRRRRMLSAPGTLVLVGAGKMGGALLTGWLELGLDPRKVVVIEPQPPSALIALKRRGLRLNPAAKTAAMPP